jgi:ADP-ribose pyrophosphatase YjhB (NUDIX family)
MTVRRLRYTFCLEYVISSKSVLTPIPGTSRVCLVPRGRTQRTSKDGVPVAAGEGTEKATNREVVCRTRRPTKVRNGKPLQVGVTRRRGLSGHLYSQAFFHHSPAQLPVVCSTAEIAANELWPVDEPGDWRLPYDDLDHAYARVDCLGQTLVDDARKVLGSRA